MKYHSTRSIAFLLFYLFSLHIIPQTSNYGFYYVSGSGQHGIYLARKNQTVGWTRGDKLIINGQFNGNAVDPDVIKLSDSNYRIYYYKGYFVSPPPVGYKNHEIYTAISSDGINYINELKAFEAEGITDPSVVQLNDGTFLMVCVRGNLNIFAKSNDGINFQSTGVTIQNGGIPELVKLDNGSVRLFYNGPGGIVSSISTDGGNTWSKESGTRLSSTKFIADPSVIKIDNNKWYLIVKGFNNTGAQNPAGHNVLLSESNDCYTFNYINGVLLDSASVPEGIVLDNEVSVSNERFPTNFQLYQNYPNPFNPSTVISFQLLVNSFVTLKVFDVLGKEVATLVDNYQLAGEHSVTFALQSSLSSGVYFYQLKAGNSSAGSGSCYIETKKMMVIK